MNVQLDTNDSFTKVVVWQEHKICIHKNFNFHSEMLANELLSNTHGQTALRAVHRFLAHNHEWVGQTIGAGLGPESEEGVGVAVGVAHGIIPWGYCLYRQTPCHDMISNIGGVNIKNIMSYNIDWETGYRYRVHFTSIFVCYPNYLK